jgi:hypothetical protein
MQYSRLNCKHPSIGDNISVLLGDSIKSCWDDYPEERPDFWSFINLLKSGQFQLLPGVEIQKVLVYVAEIEAMETRCYHTPINLPPIHDW